MKIGTVRMVVGLLLAGALTASAVAEEKIGVVNGQDTVKQFYKTQAATESLRKLDEELRDAQRRMVAKLTELDDEVKKAIAEANDKALSEEARARKRTAAEEKVADLKEYEVQVRKSDMDNRKKLEEQHALMFKPIFQEVRQVVAEVSKEMGMTLVLDASETGPVLYFENRLDMTDAVLKRLNKDAPAAPAKTEAEKPADPKQATK